MGTTAITPTPLVVNVFSADILDAAGTVADTPADGWAIAPPDMGTGPGRDTDVVLKFLAPAGGDTVVVVAGDRPPSQRSGLGDESQVFGANEVRYVILDKSRFLQDDGTFLVTCGDGSTTCYAFTIPKKLS